MKFIYSRLILSGALMLAVGCNTSTRQLSGPQAKPKAAATGTNSEKAKSETEIQKLDAEALSIKAEIEAKELKLSEMQKSLGEIPFYTDGGKTVYLKFVRIDEMESGLLEVISKKSTDSRQERNKAFTEMMLMQRSLEEAVKQPAYNTPYVQSLNHHFHSLWLSTCKIWNNKSDSGCYDANNADLRHKFEKAFEEALPKTQYNAVLNLEHEIKALKVRFQEVMDDLGAAQA